MTRFRCTAPSSADFATAFAPALLAALIVVLLPGCKPAAFTSLGAPETFVWEGEPLSFSPPPEPWRREAELSGGLHGVRFVKAGSVGEGITVAEYYTVGKRASRAELRELLERLESYDVFEFRKALDRAGKPVDAPFTPAEADVAKRVNTALNSALYAHKKRDLERTRAELETALQAVEELQFSLGDVIDGVIFQPEKRNEPQMYKLLGRRDVKIAGEPAVTVDYTVHVNDRLGDRLYYGREAYVMHNNHLFVAKFIGLKESLSLFDNVVASIRFPQ